MKGSETPSKPQPPSLFFYMDYKAIKDSEGEQAPIRVCAETKDCDETKVFYGEDCLSC